MLFVLLHCIILCVICPTVYLHCVHLRLYLTPPPAYTFDSLHKKSLKVLNKESVSYTVYVKLNLSSYQRIIHQRSHKFIYLRKFKIRENHRKLRMISPTGAIGFNPSTLEGASTSLCYDVVSQNMVSIYVCNLNTVIIWITYLRLRLGQEKLSKLLF